VRPAVSVRRTRALVPEFDAFDFGLYSDLGNDSYPESSLSGYLDAPDSNGADSSFFESGIQPLINSFDFNNNHMDGHNNGPFDDFNLDDFVHHDDQPAPEIQSSDSLAETTANLQPPLGASLDGCDFGGNAVSV